VRLALLTALLFCPVPITLVEMVPAETPLTPRVLFVVDVSGSMEGHELGRAVAAVRQIAGQPVDELEFGVLAFADDVTRWAGWEDDDAPPGWALAPNADAVEAASRWLADLGADGHTRVIPALEAGLAVARPGLSLVLVSDGAFYQEGEAEVLAAFEAGQRAREQAGNGRAVLLCYGVGARGRPVMDELGRVGRGGSWQERREEPAPPVQLSPR